MSSREIKGKRSNDVQTEGDEAEQRWTMDKVRQQASAVDHVPNIVDEGRIDTPATCHEVAGRSKVGCQVN